MTTTQEQKYKAYERAVKELPDTMKGQDMVTFICGMLDIFGFTYKQASTVLVETLNAFEAFKAAEAAEAEKEDTA